MNTTFIICNNTTYYDIAMVNHSNLIKLKRIKKNKVVRLRCSQKLGSIEIIIVKVIVWILRNMGNTLKAIVKN